MEHSALLQILFAIIVLYASTVFAKSIRRFDVVYERIALLRRSIKMVVASCEEQSSDGSDDFKLRTPLQDALVHAVVTSKDGRTILLNEYSKSSESPEDDVALFYEYAKRVPESEVHIAHFPDISNHTYQVFFTHKQTDKYAIFTLIDAEGSDPPK